MKTIGFGSRKGNRTSHESVFRAKQQRFVCQWRIVQIRSRGRGTALGVTEQFKIYFKEWST